MRAWWRDGKARALCGYSGDPRSIIAANEPEAAPASQCDRPWDSIGQACYNKENFIVAGQGSFVENDNFSRCTISFCGSSKADACKMHLRISKRYSSDNYKVYFKQYSTSIRIIASTAHLTAWKHIHIEKDKMCRKSAILSESFDPVLCFPSYNLEYKGYRDIGIALFDKSLPYFNISDAIANVNNNGAVVA